MNLKVMNKTDIVKKVCEILEVKHSHYDVHMSDTEYFPNMKLDSPVRLVAYPGMCPWSFAILEDMTVITPTSRFSILIEQVYESLEGIDESKDLREKYEEMIGDVRKELGQLKLAKEFLIENKCNRIINGDQPNPDGGASTASLMMELGKSPEEALKIDHDIQKIVNDE